MATFTTPRIDADWARKLQPLIYNNQTVLFENVSTDNAMQTVTTAIPYSDKPVVKNYGAGKLGFSVDAYFIGGEYLIERKQFTDSLKTLGGTPTLIQLPTQEARMVLVEGYKTVHTNNQGGFGKVTVSFVEVPRVKLKPLPKDTRRDALAQIGESRAISTDTYVEVAELDNQPSFVADDSVDGISDFMNGLASGFDLATDILKDVIKFKNNPLAYIEGIIGGLTGTTDAINSIKGSYNFISNFSNWFFPVSGSDDNNLSTSSGLAVNNNRDLMQASIRTNVLSSLVEIAVDIPYKSREEAIDIRTDLSNRFDEVLVSFESNSKLNDMYLAVVELKSRFLTDINARGASLPLVKEIELLADTPALVISYNQYKNIDMVDDIVNRNGAESVLEIKAGTVEVLVDG